MNRYVAIALICIAVLCPLPGPAQVQTDSATTIVERINASGNIEVVVPEAMNARLQKTAGAEAEQAEAADAREHSAAQGRVGYRIQVFDDNNPRTARSEAQSRKRQIDNRFPEWRCYVQFNSPYWRVKVGDFRSRGEAEAAIEDMRRAFPHMSAQLRIVRDRINIAE